MKKNIAGTEATRHRLLDAFWDVFAEKPFTQITVREIAERAGVNRSTFYAYYKDVYDILEQAEQEIISALLVEHKWHDKSMLDRAQYEADLRDIGDFLIRHQKPLSVLMGENGDPHFTQQMWRTAWTNLRQNIVDISGCPDEPMLDYLVEYIIHCHAAILLLWFKNGCDIPFEQISGLIYRLMTDGVISYLTKADSSNPYDKIADYILKRIKDNLQ